MKMLRARWIKAGAVSALIFGMASAASAAPATVDARDLLLRLQRLERDMRDVQAETFRQNGGKTPEAPAAAPAPAAPAPEAAPAPAPVMLDLDPLIRRLTDLEDSIGRLTGQMEELGHQVDQVSQKTDRLQKQLDFQASQGMHADAGANVAAAPGADIPPAPPTESGTTVASLAPPEAAAPSLRGAPPANLGQIPANTPLPNPSAARPADPKTEFDGAMNLLARAQYDQASQAFRKFADDHPDEDKASDALYWTGDIAYSAKKDYPEAARDFAELLKKYPKAQHAPEGMLKLGLALFELGQMKEGCAALAALPAKYPDATAAVATRAKSERANNKCK